MGWVVRRGQARDSPRRAQYPIQDVSREIKVKRMQPTKSKTGSNRIRVMIADDHAVMREGLKLLISACDVLEVVGEASNGHQAVQMALGLRPDVIVMDVAMPLLNGMEAARQIVREWPKARVLILSSYRDDQHVRTSLNNGAAGYVAKHGAMQEVIQAIREVHANHTYFSPQIANRLSNLMLSEIQGRDSAVRGPELLSSRQVETLQLIAEGHGNKQIADVLGISVKTVEKHRQEMMDRLNIHDIAGLTRYAVQHGLVESPAIALGI
jgi:DNA-binding NarL/FixJ family response regulator